MGRGGSVEGATDDGDGYVEGGHGGHAGGNDHARGVEGVAGLQVHDLTYLAGDDHGAEAYHHDEGQELGDAYQAALAARREAIEDAACKPCVGL